MNVDLEVSESYSGLPVMVPITVWRAEQPGPTVFITGAVHGDELNGTGVIRELLLNQPVDLQRGSLILVPVVNMLGLERHQRYLPDRRDLNRCFPGDAQGSLARRFARAFFEAVVVQSDYGIDLHTAAVRRTNFPNVRADLNLPRVAQLAELVGSEVTVNGKGPKGSLRRAACGAGCPTLIIEAGEVWKIEPSVVEHGVRCIRNALIGLDMAAGKPARARYQVRVERTRWIRSGVGGMLQFHVAPGEVVTRGQALATISDLHGREVEPICADAEGIIIGMTTLPTVSPGDAVFHLAIPKEGLEEVRRARRRAPEESLHERLRDDLSSSVAVSEPADDG
jgi:predicted deacylase